MSDVFISYARSDEEHAAQVADALRASGHRIWRDDELPAHRAYADVIEERLKSAKAVVVLWSAEAAKSQWVRSEADAARQLGTLVQATLDGSIPPMPFDQIQCADLGRWKGEASAPGWRKLAASVAALAGEPVPAVEKAQREAARHVSICVLPFSNMSGDAEQEYFSDGISEDITTDLSKVSALEVIARNTAFQFKGQSVDVCDIARKLGVSHILEGSVRKAGNRVRITAQLIDGRGGGHIWAERYDRDLTDNFAIQDEISHSIVDALKLRLLPEEKKAIEDRGTASVDAYNLYLMARSYWVRGNHGDIRREQRVIRLCERIVEIDPCYARAWALLSLAQSNLKYGFGKCETAGLEAADKAIELDPTIAEAHCVRARYLFESGDVAAADEEIACALRLGADSWEVNKEAARLFYHQRRVADAAHHYERAVALDEADYHSWSMLASCYQALGDLEKQKNAARMMVSHAERVIAEDPSNGMALAGGVAGLAILGQGERAKEWMNRALLIDPENLNMRYNFACVLASSLGDVEAALDLLKVNFAKCGGMMIRIAAKDPDLDNLRSNPRFRKMFADAMKRLGLMDELTPLDPPPATPAEGAERPRS
jgi:adenylate cyclase